MYVEGGAPLNPMNLLAPSDMVKNLYSVPVSTGFISDLAKYTYLNFDATASPQVPFHGPATSSSYMVWPEEKKWTQLPRQRLHTNGAASTAPRRNG